MVRSWVRVLGAMFIGLCMIGSANSTPPTAEDFIPEFFNVQLSPDGAHVATVRPFDGRNAVVIYRFDETPASGAQPVAVIPSGADVDIVGYRWANNSRLLIYVGWAFQNVNQWYDLEYENSGGRMVSIDLDGTDVHLIGDISFGNVVSMLPNESDSILVQRLENGRIRVHRYNIYTGDSEIVRTGRSGDGLYIADQDGDIRALLNWGWHVDLSVYWRNPNSRSWRRVLRYNFEEGRGLSLLGFGDNGNELYFSSNHEGRYGIYQLRPDRNLELERLYLHGEVDVSGYGGSSESGDPLYVSFVDDLVTRDYLDEEFEALDRKFGRELPGEIDISVQSTRDGMRHVIWSGGAGTPATFYLYSAEQDAYSLFAPAYPELRADQLANVRRVDYEARDGLSIRSYLAVPPGANEGPMPLVVMPHGGPFAQDTQHFDALRQFIASRGYAVFTPNYRGSTGLGNEFHETGWGEWGMGMQDDVTDGVLHLISEGIADPSRICILGWSYGAYAALHGAVTTPNLFQCAVGINGVYDVSVTRAPRQFRYFGAGSYAGIEQWDHFIGNAQFSREDMQALSPRHNANRVQIPVLLIASSQDPIARIAQSEDMARALRRADVDLGTLFFSQGNHSMTYGPSRISTYQRIEGFLAQHLR